jgi:hypothetical protein
VRLAASRKQIVSGWRPVAFKLYPNGRQSQTNSHHFFFILHVTGGHAGTICMQLAATRVQFECDWLPVACYFCMRLAATQIQFVCDWRPNAHYFSTFWQIVYHYENATGGHLGTICMRLAANWLQFECDWLPNACYFCMRLAASSVQSRQCFESTLPKELF